MKREHELHQLSEGSNIARPRWVKNAHSEIGGLKEVVKLFLVLFLVVQSIVLFISFFIGLTHPLTIFNSVVAIMGPCVVLGTALLQTKKSEPDDLYISNLVTWSFRLIIAFGANIALIVSIDFGVFPVIFNAFLIACIVIELLAYLTYCSYSDDMIREIIEERKMLSPVNENNEFWFLSRGGDVGSERLLIKGKWHLRLLYAVAYMTPFVFISGGKINSAFILTFITIAAYFIFHGLFTGYYVTRRGLQMRLEGKL
ncbi:hypothetical protein DN062_00380 [Nitrincola tibetensis]|uniref:Uncharacterized protein n=1 Tax=Nitrincola tibetensis TaxID=2219697 RepID=A0A364NR34_9GAMM|nr:hypothetical protein [Nitrincola tibetensis]RAU19579.1 hypothetical protein DN062_00380 [Nitrincola tibetensis]